MQPRIFTSDDYALDWARSHLQFDSSELVSNAPWARTYKLHGRSDQAFLKLLPPACSQSTTTTPVLARQFPHHLPEVISRDAELGLLLLRYQRGRRLDRDASDDERRRLLNTYAGIQAKVSKKSDLLGLFPTLDLEDLVPRLLDFLNPSAPRGESGGKVGSVYFLGRTKSRRYHDALYARSDLLAKQIALAGQLPATVNHCDLRLKNATVIRDDTIVLTNWDDATVGPAGLSLHALFKGCSKPATIIEGSPLSDTIARSAQDRFLLDAYMGALAEGGYAEKSELERCLPGAICAGAVKQLTWYASYPDDSRRYRRRVRRNLESQLSDLLDFCDLIALRDRLSTLRCAVDYRSNGRSRRAERLLRRHLSTNRNDPQALTQLASVLHERKKRPEAIETFRNAVELRPNDAGLLNDYGVALMEDLRFDDAITMFRRASHLDSNPKAVRANLERASQLRECSRAAERPEEMPTLPVSDAERNSGQLQAESLALGAELFNKYGVLLVENAFDAEFIRACDDHFIHEYQDYFRDTKHADALSIGDKRFQITVALDGPLNNPHLYANPFVMGLMKQLLGAKFFLGCTVCAASLPGSKDQHLHKDHRALFTKNADDPPMQTPPFAITTMIPLVPLDEMSGTTTVRKGSHLVSRRDSPDLPRQVPIVPVGSCFLMDLRLSHQGLGNKTNRVRPIFNFVYQQPWFADNKNFQKQPPLRIPASQFEKIPEELRSLFAWVTQPGPDI